jgi:hypothetical protein
MRNRSITFLVLSTLLAACALASTPEERVLQEIKNISPQREASSPDQCDAILQSQSWCTITKSAKRITRPEWDALFPKTEFFLVEYALIGEETQQLHHVLVIKQDWESFRADSFDRLLDMNRIVITDRNRELVAKAFALTTLGDYLGEEIDFTDWQAGKWQGEYPYDHYLKAWTKVQGIEFWWWFTFENDRFKFITRDGISDYHTRDYIDVPLLTLPLPPLVDYRFTQH